MLKKALAHCIVLALVLSMPPVQAFAKVQAVHVAFQAAETGESAGYAIRLSLNEEYICNSNAVMWYRVEVTEVGLLTLGFKNGTGKSDGRTVRLHPIENMGTDLLSDRLSSQLGSWGYSGSVGLAPGSYFIEVLSSRLSVSDAVYSILPSFSPNPHCEAEHNGTMLTANRISPGISYVGSSQANLDYDWFELVLPTAGNVRFDLDLAVVGSNYVNIEMLDFHGNELWNTTTFKSKVARVSEALVLSAGTYYVCITGRVYNATSSPDQVPRYTLKTTYALSKPLLGKLVAKKGSLKAKWSKSAYADGYELKYSRKSSFANSKVIALPANTKSKKISHLKRNKRYFVKVRAYKDVEGVRYLSSWSTRKTVKVK